MRQGAPSKQLLLLWQLPGCCGAFLPSGDTRCLGHWAWGDAGLCVLSCSSETAWQSARSAGCLLSPIHVLVSISFWSLRALHAYSAPCLSSEDHKWYTLKQEMDRDSCVFWCFCILGDNCLPWCFYILVIWTSSCSLLVPKTKLMLWVLFAVRNMLINKCSPVDTLELQLI